MSELLAPDPIPEWEKNLLLQQEIDRLTAALVERDARLAAGMAVLDTPPTVYVHGMADIARDVNRRLTQIRAALGNPMTPEQRERALEEIRWMSDGASDEGVERIVDMYVAPLLAEAERRGAEKALREAAIWDEMDDWTSRRLLRRADRFRAAMKEADHPSPWPGDRSGQRAIDDFDALLAEVDRLTARHDPQCAHCQGWRDRRAMDEAWKAYRARADAITAGGQP